MTDHRQTTDAAVPQEAAFGAVVNSPEPVTLWSPDGEPIVVNTDKADYWVRRGFSRTRVDLDTMLAELTALTGALIAPWQVYVAASKAAGQVDDQAQIVALAALDQVGAAADRLHRGIHDKFPVAQAAETQEG